jgi:hypothetical protein
MEGGVPKAERERIGPLVITSSANLDVAGDIVCTLCKAVLARLQPDGSHDPSPEALLAAGRVAVPNFGWFCDQKSAVEYEAAFGVTFQRDKSGNISYY